MRRTAVLAAAVLLTCVGCAVGPDQPPQEAPMATAVTSRALPAAATLGGVTCSPDAQGVWSFRARLSNTSPQDQRYVIVVTLVRRQGSSVAASTRVVRQVAGRASVEVAADRFATADPAQVLCVPSTRVGSD